MTTDQTLDSVPSPDVQADITTPDTTEGAAPADDAPEPPEDPKDIIAKLNKSKARQDKRFQQKDAALREERRARAELEKEVEKYKSAQPGPQKTTAKKAADLNIDDYDDAKDYLREYNRLTAEELKAELKAELAEHSSKSKTEGEAAKLQAAEAAQLLRYQESWNKKAEKVAETLPDYDEVMKEIADFQVTPYLRDALYEADDGPSVLYYAAKEDLLEHLSKVSPARIGYEIARLEDKAKALLEKPKPVSKTPAPIKTVSGGSSAGTKQPHQMSPSELVKWLKS